MLSLGILASLALSIANRSVGLVAGSPLFPSFTAIMIIRATFVNVLPLLASTTAFLCLIVDHLLCPDMPSIIASQQLTLDVISTIIYIFLQLMNPNLPDLINKSIKAALSQSWTEAIDLNLHILQHKPNDIPTLNRLAKAYEKSYEPDKAKKTYQKVLKLDRFNNIAISNLSRIKKSPPRTPSSDITNSHPQKTFSFIEEPGKTKTASLTKLAPKQVINSLDTSQVVILKPYRRRISVFTTQGTCIGSLPDDLSRYLLRLIKLGNKYEAAIRNISRSQIEIFIREIHKSKRLKGLPSFPLKDTKNYFALLPTDPIAEVPLELPESET